jgi:hypothetical protein
MALQGDTRPAGNGRQLKTRSRPLKRTPVKRPIHRLECRGGELRRVPIKRTPVRKRSRRVKPGDNPKYRRWVITSRECVVCVKGGAIAVGHEWMRTIIDPCHTKNGGVALKGPDCTCAPLCRAHHLEYDAGRERFGKKYAIDMPAEAAMCYAIYERKKAA